MKLCDLFEAERRLSLDELTQKVLQYPLIEVKGKNDGYVFYTWSFIIDLPVGITNDQIHQLVVKTADHPELTTPGVVTKSEDSKLRDEFILLMYHNIELQWSRICSWRTFVKRLTEPDRDDFEDDERIGINRNSITHSRGIEK